MPHFIVRTGMILVHFVFEGYGEPGPRRPFAGRGDPAFVQHARSLGLRVRPNSCDRDADQSLPWKHGGLLSENETRMGGMHAGCRSSHSFLTFYAGTSHPSAIAFVQRMD